MSNSNGGFNLAAVAQSSLTHLKRKFGPILAYTTDFSGAMLTPGAASITTRVIANITGNEYTTTSTGYTTTDITSTAVTVTPTILYGQYVLNDLERQQMSISPRQVVGTLVNAVANQAFSKVNGLVLSANYATSTTIATGADFDADDLADINATLTGTKQAQDERVAIIEPAYYANLSKDADVSPAYAYGTDSAIKDYKIPRVRGVNIYEVTDVATNSQNLIGWVSDTQAIVAVSRMPSIPTVGAIVNVETVTDEETGLSLALTEEYYNGNWTIKCSTLFGVAKGTDTLVRIVTA